MPYYASMDAHGWTLILHAINHLLARIRGGLA